MKVNGMLKIFHRSEDLYSTKCLNYTGYAGIETWFELQKSHVYGPKTNINKVECTGFIQKAMSRRLGYLKNFMHKKKLAGGKTLNDNTRLTDKFINK